MTKDKAILSQEILDYPGVYDCEHKHHEFYDGRHGRKLDLSAIPQKTQLYSDLITGQAEDIKRIYRNGMPQVIIGIAENGNRIIDDLADELDNNIISLKTERDGRNRALIGDFAGRALLRKLRPDLVLVVESVGTTGKSVRPVVEQLHHNVGFNDCSLQKRQKTMSVAAYFTWQRQPRLKNLERSLRNYHSVHYNSFIVHPLKTYQDMKACLNDSEGFCANNVELILYES